jgi:signal transduction histidine kinase
MASRLTRSGSARAQIIHDETGRLHRMVESLLDLARLEAGSVALERRPVQIDAILRRVVEGLAVRAQEQTVTLRLELPDALPPVHGDGDRLAQVFTNLVDNALNHTPPGGTITLQAQTAAEGLAIAVQDSGPGIPPDDLPRVFERFYQVDKSRQRDPGRGGIGLGWRSRGRSSRRMAAGYRSPAHPARARPSPPGCHDATLTNNYRRMTRVSGRRPGLRVSYA